MENKKINILGILSKGYIIGAGVVLGIATTFAITSLSTDYSWSESSFEAGSKLTQNMMLAQTMGYTCYNSSCSQKVYWRKFDNTQRYWNDAALFCSNNGMELPATDQMHYYSAYGYYGIDYSAGYVQFGSMTSAGSRHWGGSYGGQGFSCSSGYNCRYYDVTYPNSRTSNTSQWGYSQAYVVCVYKAWAN